MESAPAGDRPRRPWRASSARSTTCAASTSCTSGPSPRASSALAAHVVVDARAPTATWSGARLEVLLGERFGIEHTTLQMEEEASGGAARGRRAASSEPLGKPSFAGKSALCTPGLRIISNRSQPRLDALPSLPFAPGPPRDPPRKDPLLAMRNSWHPRPSYAPGAARSAHSRLRPLGARRARARGRRLGRRAGPPGRARREGGRALRGAATSKDVLTTEIADYSDKIEQLEGEIAMLRNREAMVAGRARRGPGPQLDAERDAPRRPAQPPAPLDRRALEDRLVADLQVRRARRAHRDPRVRRLRRPDRALRVPEAHRGVQDSAIVDRVRTMRNDTETTVERIRDRARRDRRQGGRARAHPRRSSRPARPSSRPRGPSARSCSTTSRSNIERLEGDISDRAGRDPAAARQRLEPRRCPAGPIQGGSGMIWPVNGPVISPFGWRWGRMHEGIDIAVPAGTPIRAARAGVVALAAPDERLRQLHLHQPRRRALDLLRAPVDLRRGRRRQPRRGRGDRLRRLHRVAASATTCTSRSGSTAPPSIRWATCSLLR